MRFADNIRLPDQAYAWLARSPHAHARIARVDVATAKPAPGGAIADARGIAHLEMPAAPERGWRG